MPGIYEPEPDGGYDCQKQPGDERSGIRDSNSILASLDDMLADDGGAYSATQMPIKQAIQYSLIALNRKNHDDAMKLVQQLASQIVGRVQHAEQAVEKLASPFRRTLRGMVNQAEKKTGQILKQLADAVTARTAYNQQMLGDLQTRMLGGSPSSEATPGGAGESGIPSQSPSPSDGQGTGTSPEQQYAPGTPGSPSQSSQPYSPSPSSPSPNYAPNHPAPDCPVFDICPDGYLWQFLKWWWQFEYPKLVHCLCQKQNIVINVYAASASQAIQGQQEAEWQKIAVALKSTDPDKQLQDDYGVEPDPQFSPPPVGIEPNPIESEHFPDEVLPDEL